MAAKNKKKALATAGIILLYIVLLAAASFIPALWLESPGMRQLKGEYVTVYYEKQENAAKDVFEQAEKGARELYRKLNLAELETVDIYIYDTQFEFQTKKYGLIGALLGLDWYIGDNRGTDVLLTSPANPGKAHTYEECRDAALHEMVHACNSIINPDMPLWLNEGVALYLTNGNPPANLYNTCKTPSFQDIHTADPVRFSDMGGYYYAYTYVEYLDATYGWEKVLSLLKTGDPAAAFGQSEESVYDGWLEYLKIHYTGKPLNEICRGFIKNTQVKKYGHLPFTVCFMTLLL